MEFRLRQFLKPFSGYSLKVRLSAIFLGIMMLGILTSGFALYEQYRMSVRGSEMMIRERTRLELVLKLREYLNDSAIFKNVLFELRSLEGSDTTEQALLREIEAAHDAFISVRRDENAEQVQGLLAGLEAAVQNHSDRLVHHLRREQESSIRFSITVLSVFILLLLAWAFRSILIVTRPLSELATYLDRVDFEKDLPTELPKFHYHVSELARVSSSFNRLLERLRGFQALNLRRLLEEKRQAEIISTSISDGIFLFRKSELLFVNRVGRRILGTTSGNPWQGVNIDEAIGPGGPALCTNRGLVALHEAATRTMPVEYVMETSDHRKLYYLLQSYPIPSELVEKVSHAVDASSGLVLDRWRARMLVVARDVTLVRESQEAKSHFVATLSHEIKTPVTSLTMATRLLKKNLSEFKNENHRLLIQTCADDVDRMRKLIDDLLSLSRFDSLANDVNIKGIDLIKLLRQSVQYFQDRAFERGITIRMPSHSGKPLVVPMDPAKISWVISILMTNAFRHAPRGSKVEVGLSTMPDYVEVRVRDYGPGIEESRQDKIFDKFSSFYDVRVARSGSVGMGLAVAKEIISGHQGSIWLSSEFKQGAEFCFRLPLKIRENVITGDPVLSQGNSRTDD